MPIVLSGDLRQVWDTICLKASNSRACQGTYVVIAGLKGVDVVSGWTNDIASPLSFQLAVESSTVAFYIGNQVPSEYQCTERAILANVTAVSTFFNSYFYQITFDISVKYDQTNPVCPFLFANAFLPKLEIFALVYSFLVTNLFRFHQLNSSSTTLASINSKITTLNLQGYN
jgi:hypothetical protein